MRDGGMAPEESRQGERVRVLLADAQRERLRAGIGLSDALIRVSAGIENERDLIGDFGQALA